MIRLTDIRVKPDERHLLKKKIISRLRIKENQIIRYQIYKKSVDARKSNMIYFVYTVDVEVNNEDEILQKAKNPSIFKTPDIVHFAIKHGSQNLEKRPVIIGTGPSGLFAGLLLAQHGYRPIVLERGEDVDSRTKTVDRFWSTGILNPESNVQFGEGGAGTFSDGKLTSLINDKKMRMITEEFVKAGAPGEILYINKPHVGTDLLKQVVKNIRADIVDNGGEVRFKSKVTDLLIKGGIITGVEVNGSEIIDCQVAILAIGHSARDTFQILYNRGININPKPFSIGVRIEHSQNLINRAQYGKFAGHPALKAADYKLAYHSKSGRSAYTFCMCPGGFVVAAASENGGVVTNGMSYYRRDGDNANAALLVGVNPEDYGSSHPLSGVEFQRRWESLAYQVGEQDYKAPVQKVGDFLSGRVSTEFGEVLPTYKPGVVFADMRSCLPDYVINTIKETLEYFDTKIKGFAMNDALVTGVETRSSSPVRILRSKGYESNVRGLYPAGEGAGYAGGIMSSAVDGIGVAEQIISLYSRPQKI